MGAIRASLLEGDVALHIRRLSFPLIWGMMALNTFNIADTYFISRLGTTQLAALGFTIPVVMCFMGIVFGFTVGTSSVLSRIYGEGDFEKVRQGATDAVTLSITFTLAAALAGYIFIGPVFRLMGASDALMPMIRTYMAIWYCGLSFFGLMLIGNACVRATGDTRFPSMMMASVSIVNLILDPCFIFGWGIFPKLGLAGAATAWATSNAIVSAVSFYILIFRRGMLAPAIFHAGFIQSWKRILHVGVPTMISNQVSPISAAVIIWMAVRFGHEAVAALGIAARIENFSMMAFYALATGVSIFSGQNFGAGNHGRVQEAVAVGTRYALFWGLFLATVFWIFAREIPQFFTENAMVAAYAKQYLHWVPISYGAMGTVVIANAALNAMGKPLPSMVLIMLRALVLYVPLAWIGQRYFGFTGILMALMVTNFTVGFISYMWNKKVAS